MHAAFEYLDKDNSGSVGLGEFLESMSNITHYMRLHSNGPPTTRDGQASAVLLLAIVAAGMAYRPDHKPKSALPHRSNDNNIFVIPKIRRGNSLCDMITSYGPNH